MSDSVTIKVLVPKDFEQLFANPLDPKQLENIMDFHNDSFILSEGFQTTKDHFFIGFYRCQEDGEAAFILQGLKKDFSSVYQPFFSLEKATARSTAEFLIDHQLINALQDRDVEKPLDMVEVSVTITDIPKQIVPYFSQTKVYNMETLSDIAMFFGSSTVSRIYLGLPDLVYLGQGEHDVMLCLNSDLVVKGFTLREFIKRCIVNPTQ